MATMTEKEKKDIVDLFSVLVAMPKDVREYMKGYSQAVIDHDLFKKEGA